MIMFPVKVVFEDSSIITLLCFYYMKQYLQSTTKAHTTHASLISCKLLIVFFTSTNTRSIPSIYTRHYVYESLSMHESMHASFNRHPLSLTLINPHIQCSRPSRFPIARITNLQHFLFVSSYSGTASPVTYVVSLLPACSFKATLLCVP